MDFWKKSIMIFKLRNTRTDCQPISVIVCRKENEVKCDRKGGKLLYGSTLWKKQIIFDYKKAIYF